MDSTFRVFESVDEAVTAVAVALSMKPAFLKAPENVPPRVKAQLEASCAKRVLGAAHGVERLGGRFTHEPGCQDGSHC